MVEKIESFKDARDLYKNIEVFFLNDFARECFFFFFFCLDSDVLAFGEEWWE